MQFVIFFPWYKGWTFWEPFSLCFCKLFYLDLSVSISWDLTPLQIFYSLLQHLVILSSIHYFNYSFFHCICLNRYNLWGSATYAKEACSVVRTITTCSLSRPDNAYLPGDRIIILYQIWRLVFSSHTPGIHIRMWRHYEHGSCKHCFECDKWASLEKLRRLWR